MGPTAKLATMHRVTNTPLAKVGLPKQKIRVLAKMRRLGTILGKHRFWPDIGKESVQNEKSPFLKKNQGESEKSVGFFHKKLIFAILVEFLVIILWENVRFSVNLLSPYDTFGKLKSEVNFVILGPKLRVVTVLSRYSQKWPKFGIGASLVNVFFWKHE